MKYVQIQSVKRDLVNCVLYVLYFKFPGLCFCQELTKLDDIGLSYHKLKKVPFFLRHNVQSNMNACIV